MWRSRSETYSMWQCEHSYRGFEPVKKYDCFGYEIGLRAAEHSMLLITGSDADVRRIALHDAQHAPRRDAEQVGHPSPA